MVISKNKIFLKNFYRIFKNTAVEEKISYNSNIGVSINYEPMSFEQLNELLDSKDKIQIKSICLKFCKEYAQL